MAVYTVLDQGDIDTLAVTLGLGTPLHWQPVGAGIENTTYFLTCEGSQGIAQEYVVTLAEAASAADVDFVASWMSELASNQLPVPTPQRHPVTGELPPPLRGKPVLVAPRIKGEHLLTPGASQCEAIGRFLGVAHRVALHSGRQHSSPRDLDWMVEAARRLLPQLDHTDQQLLTEELARLDALQRLKLPTGIIHGDLFRDNALFDGSTLTAIIDFFMAGSGPLGLDLAIAVNDWCSHPDHSLDPRRTSALLQAYQRERLLTPEEQEHWADLLCLAAARFWVSRLQAGLEPRTTGSDALPGSKSPDELRALLLLRRRSS